MIAENTTENATKTATFSIEKAKTTTSSKNAEQDKKTKKRVAPTYSISDLAEKSQKTQKVPPEVVTVALRTGGKARYTRAEAKELIAQFLKKEVK